MQENYNYMTDGSILKVKILSDKSKIPLRTSLCAAGFDLYSAEDKIIEPYSVSLISTGIAVEIPPLRYGRIAPKSSLSKKTMIGAGVIDWDYRGDVKVLIYNLTNTQINISCGDAVAQLILEKISMPNLIVADSLSYTSRNTSAGINKVIH